MYIGSVSESENWRIHKLYFMYLLLHVLDPWAEAEGPGPRGQVQEARPEEGEGVGRRDDESSAGLQTQGLHGPQSQPQVCEEGGRQTGQGIKTCEHLVSEHPWGSSRMQV